MPSVRQIGSAQPITGLPIALCNGGPSAVINRAQDAILPYNPHRFLYPNVRSASRATSRSSNAIV
jgi:hypothetical protein